MLMLNSQWTDAATKYLIHTYSTKKKNTHTHTNTPITIKAWARENFETIKNGSAPFYCSDFFYDSLHLELYIYSKTSSNKEKVKSNEKEWSGYGVERERSRRGKERESE